MSHRLIAEAIEIIEGRSTIAPSVKHLQAMRDEIRYLREKLEQKQNYHGSDKPDFKANR